MKIQNEWMQNKWSKWETSILLDGEKNEKKVEPDVALSLNDSATMVSNSHGFYLKQFLKYKIIQ